MATKIRKSTSEKKQVRFKRKRRIRSRLSGSAEAPRLCVFRSNKHLYVQLIDDEKQHTLVSASSMEKGSTIACTREGAKIMGALIAKRALEKGVSRVVFDRGGYLYHGRVKALADSARESGLKF
jgi:large subunit ribosomal protein L18